jgi:serine phosphatase RsbU (regulator of sigma subunit)
MKSIVNILIGERSAYGIEHRITNFITLFVTVLVNIFIPILIVLQFPLVNIISLVTTAVILSLCYYLSRAKSQYRLAAFLLIIVATAYLTMGWFIASGLYGTHHYFFVLNLLLIVILLRGKTRAILFIVNILIAVFLSATLFLMPDVIRYYSSKTAQNIIVSIGFLLSMLSGGIIVHQIIMELDRERENLHDKNTQYLTEMKLAKKIQQGMLQQEWPSFKGLDIQVRYQPMEFIGGDFYELVRFKEKHKIGFFISDVSGHGIPASLITGVLKTLVLTSGVRGLSPREMLSYLNEIITGQISDNYITAFYGVYDANDRSFLYSRCGHPYPILIRNNDLTELKGRGMPLGIEKEMVLDEEHLQLQTGDRILLYTDGLTECINDNHEVFGEDRFKKFILKNRELTPKQFNVALFRSLKDFNRWAAFNDDVCLIVIDVK